LRRLAALLCCVALPAIAAPLEKTGQLAVTPNQLDSFDIGVVDQASERYFLADRSNKSLDIFDLAAGRMVGQVGGFVGDRGAYRISGPNGVVIAGGEAWVGDGDSTIKVIDLTSGKVVDTIATGGTTRLDEVAWDATGRVFVGINPDETPPYATLVSTDPGRRMVGKVEVDRATDGLEQPVWSPVDGLVYIAVPELDHQPGQGGIAVVDPRDATLVTIIETRDCGGTGLARGPGSRMVMGCRVVKDGPKPHSVVFDVAGGDVVATVDGVGGADMVAFGEQPARYYEAAGRMPGGPVVGVVDAATNRWLGNVASGPGAHSVAVAEGPGTVLVPVSGKDGGCGCVELFTPR